MPGAGPAVSSLDALNRECFCFSLDPQALAQALDGALGRPGLSALVRERCPSLFSAQPVFVAARQLQRMAQVVQAVETVVTLPAFREPVLAAAPAIARVGAGPAGGPRGVFFGYDFHAGPERLALIEINTNAGGAMLNAVLARAQRACCAAMDAMVPTTEDVLAFEQNIVEMFRDEWRRAGRHRPLASIAIVDDAPEQQYLYPEFLLFEQLFQRHGLQAVIADPSALEWRGGQLRHGDLVIDLVYNRLTDFYLEAACAAALREAWLQQGVVLTPHPQAHALYADKRHLALFSDDARLRALGVPEATRQVLLAHVPHTEVVDSAQAERLWAARRGLFFKPVAGFGSRAAYRGDKLTRRVWQDILAGDYVAQALVAPGERLVELRSGGDPGPGEVPPPGATQAMKFDLRAYAYAGALQWVAARLYQGQTTNFRTPGGGFAPVYSSAGAFGARPPGRAGEAAAPGHASYVFLLGDDGTVHPLPHALYVALARGQASAPMLAGRTVRVADWYVRLQQGAPEAVVDEQYGLLQFDDQGRVDLAASPSAHPQRAGAVALAEDASWPSTAQQAAMRALVWGDTTPGPAPARPAMRGQAEGAR